MLYIVKEQFGTSTNVGHTNVGRQKPKTYKRWTVQTSDQYKRRTSTNVGPVQTSDWYTRQTVPTSGAVPTTDQYTRQTKEDNLI